ncbi:hypothetical protein B0J13DRAFT_556050 [Dactylonectria estremocensis]|uniref:Uncharacterized protein n=1 Tax=Dactylonectria estremocensis TaxID=1079267 RepID=A0A9P9J437_9HYPO|nr:hypothetical protein B0J13DRAFT_556050 [Dactylonectria estremocensis]
MAPTYVLAPNFTYHPNTSICMGDIVEYPDDPTKPLSSVPESEFKPITRHFDYDNELSNRDIKSLRGSIWANFLEKASAKIGDGTSDELLNKYTIRRLETLYFTKQPTDEEAAERVKEKKVKAAVNAGLLKKKSVFMITGLKVARGFQLSSSVSSTTNAEAKLETSVTSGAGMGTDADYSREKKAEQKHQTGQDIIFAYQLHIITHKGWAQKDVDITVHKARAALLNDDKKEGGQDSVDVEAATESALRDFDKELKVEAISAKDGKEDCVCVVFSED